MTDTFRAHTCAECAWPCDESEEGEEDGLDWFCRLTKSFYHSDRKSDPACPAFVPREEPKT